MSCFIENKMMSVERIKQFTNISFEPAWNMKDHLPPSNWPVEDNVDIKDLQVRYRPNTPLVLKGITLSISGGEKEPVLFEGTVRSNIDPIEQYIDEEIRKSLERCQLKEVVAAKPEKLDSLVADNGENWSVGAETVALSRRVILK
ncbi:ABC transporter C family member 4 [Glycine soja]